MIVFITHCWRRLRHRFDAGRILFWILMGLAAQARAGVEIDQLRVERQEQGLLLNAHLKLDLGPTVEEALVKGVAVHFVAEAELMRDRWYWYDRKVGQVGRYYRLAYQPLTRLWRLQVASEPIAVGGNGTSITQSFDTLASALDAIRLQAGWKLADAADVEADAKQYVVYRFRLDISQLPRPFQIAAGNQSGWNLSVSRTLRVQSESVH